MSINGEIIWDWKSFGIALVFSIEEKEMILSLGFLHMRVGIS